MITQNLTIGTQILVLFNDHRKAKSSRALRLKVGSSCEHVNNQVTLDSVIKTHKWRLLSSPLNLLGSH